MLFAQGTTLVVASILGSQEAADGLAPRAGPAPDLVLVDGAGEGRRPARPEAGAQDEGELPAGRLRFVDATVEAGLAGVAQVDGSPLEAGIREGVGAGVALFDYDRDGDVDLYLTNGSADAAPRDALYENDGRGCFVDRTRALALGAAAWSTGVRVADVDGDGWSDLYRSSRGPNALLRNVAARRFADVTAEAGVGDPSWSTGAAFLDFDRDGDLDLYVANYVDLERGRPVLEARDREDLGPWGFPDPRGLPASPDRFYENAGDGRFADATARVGVGAPARRGFQAVVLDYDEDGWLDLHVANDAGPNLLWHNEQGRAFADRAPRQGLALGAGGEEQGSRGIAVGDWDGDLRADLLVTSCADESFTLYRALGAGRFGVESVRAGLSALTRPLVGWGTGFHDLDADGDLDLYAVNGDLHPGLDALPFARSYRQPSLLLENDGGRLVPGDAGPALLALRSARGSAVGDVDGDGDLDLLVGELDGPPRLLRNETLGGRTVLVLLVGDAGSPDAADVIGARALATAGGRRMLRLAGTGAGFLSSDDPRLAFGVGTRAGLDELAVSWPGGGTDVWRDLAAGPATHVLRRGSGR